MFFDFGTGGTLSALKVVHCNTENRDRFPFFLSPRIASGLVHFTGLLVRLADTQTPVHNRVACRNIWPIGY
jgi:hypothetical protein